MIAEPDRLIDRALAYARCGWPVFPCRPGGKEPATRHGFHDATTDADQLRHWWNRQPRANIAVATGLPGPDVLDVDEHGHAGNGFAAYRQLDDVGLLDGAGAMFATPGGGLDVYFTGSRQGSARLQRHHLDFRAAGGYVLVPPSRVSGKEYRVIRYGPRLGNLAWSAVTLRSTRNADTLTRHRAQGTWTPAGWPHGSGSWRKATATAGCSGPRAGQPKPASIMFLTNWRLRQPGPAYQSARSGGPLPRPGGQSRSADAERREPPVRGVPPDRHRRHTRSLAARHGKTPTSARLPRPSGAFRPRPALSARDLAQPGVRSAGA